MAEFFQRFTLPRHSKRSSSTGSRAEPPSPRALRKAAEEDAEALLALKPQRVSRPRAGVLLDETADHYRDLLAALQRKSTLVVFVRDGIDLDLGDTRVKTFADPRALHRLLLDQPARDLFLDLRHATAAEQLAMWKMAYFHVTNGGAYVHARPTTTALSSWAETVALSSSRQEAGGGVFDELTASTRWVRVIELLGGEVVAYKKSRRHLYQMHDRDAADLVPRRMTGLQLDDLGTVPAETVTSRALVRHHGVDSEPKGFDETFEVPELHTWHYRGPIAIDTHMLAYRGTTALPPSFRFPAAPRLLNPRVTRVADDWCRLVPAVKPPTVTLEGDYFDVNPGFPSMFGHVMTQSLHKLWAWDDAKRRFPDLKALCSVRKGREPSFERTLLNAYGIPDDDICFINEAVNVESYISPTIIWEYALPCFASPLATDTWRRIGRGLGVTEIAPRDKLFVSRRESGTVHRFCRNTVDVEDVFQEHGFTVVYPEDHSLEDQAKMFASAKTLAGFGGSAMFNVMYGKPEHVIVLNHDGYGVRNEHLYTSLLGCSVDYFWSAADIAHPKGGWTKAAFTSPWEFDFKANGRELSELLQTLA